MCNSSVLLQHQADQVLAELQAYQLQEELAWPGPIQHLYVCMSESNEHQGPRIPKDPSKQDQCSGLYFVFQACEVPVLCRQDRYSLEDIEGLEGGSREPT